MYTIRVLCGVLMVLGGRIMDGNGKEGRPINIISEALEKEKAECNE